MSKFPDAWTITAVNTHQTLQARRDAGGFWVGELSSSALSTAVALFTLHQFDSTKYQAPMNAGLLWLKQTQNTDGGFGDTPRSRSNLSTSALCWAAWSLQNEQQDHAFGRLTDYLHRTAGTLEPSRFAKAIQARYGKDRTFSVPILTMLAVAGLLGKSGWKYVPSLPFELAALPFWCFQILRLPVVSYALPALIAIGYVKHTQRPTWFYPWRWVRRLASRRCLRKLYEIQPSTGGYLEATPLTGFVCMSLIHADVRDSPVVDAGVKFLLQSQRPDGSWPIDTNLTTWVTTLAVNAGATKEDPPETKAKLISWLLDQQWRTIHPYTQAAPGGWAWTNLPGGVPDADDTPSALIALARLNDHRAELLDAAMAGCRWLSDLQNSDGGIPTFCRGWTGLPFDRSSNDLTAHTLRAWAVWYDHLPNYLQRRLDAGIARGIAYLKTTQQPDGSWWPLWFGNEHRAEAEIHNPTYGTARVLLCAANERLVDLQPALQRGLAWLLANQNADGGWGGGHKTPSSIEETALACEALLACEQSLTESGSVALYRGRNWLCERTAQGTSFTASPIGFYFANLWYYEQLYPLIFTLAAFEGVHESAEV